VAALFASTAAHAALLRIDVLDNGVSVGTAVSTTGSVALDITTDPAFSTINVGAIGVPVLPKASLTSVALAESSASMSGTHTLTVDVTQTALTGLNAESTFVADNLIGDPGPTTEATVANLRLAPPSGVLLDSATFPAGTIASTVGPLINGIGQEAPGDTSLFLISFTGPDQSANDTIELAFSSPEPSTGAMMLVGLAGLGFAGYRRARRAMSAPAQSAPTSSQLSGF
jgi:PEP-CTERM motif